jgi:hypothetical protein
MCHAESRGIKKVYEPSATLPNMTVMVKEYALGISRQSRSLPLAAPPVVHQFDRWSIMLTRFLLGIAQLDRSERHPGLTEEPAAFKALDEADGEPGQLNREPRLLPPHARVERSPRGVHSEFGPIVRVRVRRPHLPLPYQGASVARVVNEPLQHPVRPRNSILRRVDALLVHEKR